MIIQSSYEVGNNPKSQKRAAQSVSSERAKLFSDNRKQIVSEHAHVIGIANTVTRGDN